MKSQQRGFQEHFNEIKDIIENNNFRLRNVKTPVRNADHSRKIRSRKPKKYPNENLHRD